MSLRLLILYDYLKLIVNKNSIILKNINFCLRFKLKTVKMLL